jgi:hypothetical protein
MVTSSRCGFCLSRFSVSAPGLPASTTASSRWFGNANIAISEEEKNADTTSSSSITTPPTAANVVLESDCPRTSTVAGTPAVTTPWRGSSPATLVATSDCILLLFWTGKYISCDRKPE